jgi:hypothetical protein
MLWRSLVRGVGVSAALTIAVSCAKGEDATDVGNVAIPDPDAGTDSGSLRVDSGGSSSGDTGPSDEDTGTACSGKVVINELQNNGPNSGAEFIELYNPNTCAVAIAGWKIGYASAAGNSGVNLFTFEAGDSIPAKGFILLANNKFTPTPPRVLASGMGNEGGQVGLIDDTDKVVDAVGFGVDGSTATKGKYTEGTAAPAPPTNGSIGRKTDGVDTGNNNADFKVFTAHSAGVSN